MTGSSSLEAPDTDSSDTGSGLNVLNTIDTTTYKEPRKS